MGWSCRADAAATMRAMDEACRHQTGSSNTWRDGKGNTYFWEVSRREHQDGAITGSVLRMVDDTHAVKAGSLRIAPCGRIERAPSSLVCLTEHYHGRNFGRASHANCPECYPDKAIV